MAAVAAQTAIVPISLPPSMRRKAAPSAARSQIAVRAFSAASLFIPPRLFGLAPPPSSAAAAACRWRFLALLELGDASTAEAAEAAEADLHQEQLTDTINTHDC